MARIPEADIERIKNETDLAALVRSRGIELKNHGTGNLIGKCPFHGDDKPSFIVTPDKGLFHCMGCGVAGNALQFLQKFDGLSFRHAFELLNEGKTAFISTTTEPRRRTTIQRLSSPVKPDADDYELIKQMADYYHERLFATPAACDYLKKRGLFDERALKKFKIGFADRSLGLRLPESNRKCGAEIRARLRKLGLIRKTGHEHFAGSIVIPITEPATNNITEMYGRKITPRLRKGTPNHLYLPGPHVGIWGFPEAFKSGELILCEAPLDALTFYVNSIHNVTFIFGTEGFTDELFDALLANHIKTVKIAYDADDAGNRAAERDAKRLISHGIECYRIRFPHGMDANSFAVSEGDRAERSLVRIVEYAEWIGEKRVKSGSENDKKEQPPACAGAFNSKSLAANNLVANKKISPSENPAVREVSTPAEHSACPPDCKAVGRVVENNPAKHPPAQEPICVHPCSSVVKKSPELIRSGEYHTMSIGHRHYRVSGLDKNNSLEVLKVALRLTYEINGNSLFHLDSFDMTRDSDRRRFVERAHEETGLERELLKRDLGKLLLALEDAQQERIAATVESTGEAGVYEMTADEYNEAMAFLKSPDLVERISKTFDDCGLVGEHSNRLAAYLACTSRKLDRPLAVIIQSTSAAGKTALMEAVLAFFPEEERIQYSAMTGQSLYYLGETDLKHKILAIVEEEGAEKASYALKLLQSEGELTIASTGKDANTGRMETQEYHVEGPVMIFLTTTAVDIDEELQNRCLTLTVDESREQTERIHAMQRQARTLEGLRLKKKKRAMFLLLRNIQRLLKPVDVVNPYADQLTFTANRTRTRRDHEKYLTLIDTIALLHQYQRSEKTLKDECKTINEKEKKDMPHSVSRSYITVSLSDIELANKLAPELLGRSLDELPPQTRRLCETIKTIVRERMKAEDIEREFVFFSRRQIRERLGWSVTQVRIHLERLRQLEYIASRYGRAGSAFQYELLIDPMESAVADTIGLIDIKKLQRPGASQQATTNNLTGGDKTAPSGLSC